MRVAERRQVIEVLLATGGCRNRLVSLVAFELFDAGVMNAAVAEHFKVNFDSWTYEDEAIEAAYRLIESSPTLRREWFGAR